MRPWLLPFATVVGLALALSAACRKGDRLTPSPTGPIQPSATASTPK